MRSRFDTASVEFAARALLANRSPRYERLDLLESYVDTTQYDGRKFDWFDDSEEAPPLRERRPCIAYPIVQTAIDSNVDLCLGEGKFPSICLSDGDDAEDDGADLTEDERRIVDSGIAKLVGLAKLKRVFRRGFALAQGCGSVAVIVGVRDRKPFADVEQAKRCTVERNDTGAVSRLEIRYPYVVEARNDRTGEWRKECRLYRRVIDEQRDVVYKPQAAIEDGREPTNWQEDKTKTVEHGLGFCPVVWYPHMVASETAEQVDGRAIHARALDEIEALDIALSQWHRAAFYSGDPQGYETGVDDRGPMADGRALRPIIPSSQFGGTMSDTQFGRPDGLVNPQNGEYVMRGRDKPARKKGPGVWWSYPNPDAKVGLLALPGDALKSLQDNARDLREKVAESLGVVFSDPDTVRFASALSGKAQQMLRQRQLDRCDQYRDDMADGMIIPVVQLLLRVCGTVGAKSKAIREALELLAELGDEPCLTLNWGAYYAPDPEEEKQTAEFVKAADDAIGGLPLKIKLQKLRRPLGIENVDAMVEEIEEEQEERHQKALEQEHARGSALAQAVHGPAVTGRDPKAAGGNPSKAPGSGGGAASAAAEGSAEAGKVRGPGGGRKTN